MFLTEFNYVNQTIFSMIQLISLNDETILTIFLSLYKDVF